MLVCFVWKYEYLPVLFHSIYFCVNVCLSVSSWSRVCVETAVSPKSEIRQGKQKLSSNQPIKYSSNLKAETTSILQWWALHTDSGFF